MAIKKKNNVKSVNSLENRDRAFAVLIVFLVVVAVAAPIVLFVFNPFGWNFGPSTDPSPTPTPTPTNKIDINGSKLIKSTSSVTNSAPYQVFQEEYTYGEYSYSIGFATDSAGTVSIGPVSNPTYIFSVDDTEDSYSIYIGVNVTDNKTIIKSLDVYVTGGTKLSGGSEEAYDNNLGYWFNGLTNKTQIVSLSFTYDVK